jgi:hypothetical protein
MSDDKQPQEETQTEDTQAVEQSEPEPAKTEDGVVINDPERSKRKLADWDTVELVAYLKGQLEGVPKNRLPGVVKEYRRRENLPTAWSDEEVVNYFQQGIEPEQTTNGVWKNDVTRAQRNVGDWSDEELVAWAHGEIEPKGKATVAKLTRELATRYKLSASPSDTKAVLKQFHHQHSDKQQSDNESVIETQATAEVETKPAAAPVAEAVGALTAMNVSFIDNTLERYAQTVGLNQQVSETDGGVVQRALEGLFQYVMRLEGKALKEGLDRVKVFINEHRDDVFNPSNAYRFVHLLKGSPKYQVQHVNLIELFLMAGDRNQARRQQVDMRHMLKDVPNDKIESLVDYFKNHA